MSTYPLYKDLHETIRMAVDASGDPHLARFRDGLAGEEQGWQEPATSTLPAAEYLDSMSARYDSVYQPVLEAFRRHNRSLFWEQSYKKQDGVVGDDMLAGYGFAEVIGKNGPLVSHTIRCGIGVWGPGIEYPIHCHDAEEIYVVMAGSATFFLGNNEPELRTEDSVIYVSPGLNHGFTTSGDALAVLYFWQGGDLRQMSTFS